MKKRSLLAATATALILGLAACDAGVDSNQTGNAAATEAAGSDGIAKLAPIEMEVDTSFLSAEEREVVNLLIQAANLMSEIYKRQATPDYDKLRAEVAAKNDPKLLDMFDAFFGPWDPIDEDKPFFGDKPKPAGAGFYPADLTKEAVRRLSRRASGPEGGADQPLYGGARAGRQAGRGALQPGLQAMARAGGEAARAGGGDHQQCEPEEVSLTLRAKAFRTDDYFESELAWMDLKDTPIEVAIGPYEVYTDTLYGRKTAFEAFVTLKDPKESQALDVYKGQLRDMEANLPVEERYKNFQRGFESPIAVADQVHGGGDNVPGVQTIAFNLPNDERVREAKGAKKVILRNVLGAKYERILKPMASLVLVPEPGRQCDPATTCPWRPCSTSCRTASGRDRSRSAAARPRSTRN